MFVCWRAEPQNQPHVSICSCSHTHEGRVINSNTIWFPWFGGCCWHWLVQDLLSWNKIETTNSSNSSSSTWTSSSETSCCCSWHHCIMGVYLSFRGLTDWCQITACESKLVSFNTGRRAVCQPHLHMVSVRCGPGWAGRDRACGFLSGSAETDGETRRSECRSVSEVFCPQHEGFCSATRMKTLPWTVLSITQY